jgi:hypothetical protein
MPPLGRRHRIVEQMRRRLCIDRPVDQHRQAILAFDHEILEAFGQRRRDQPRRHVAVERHARAEQGAHGRQAGPLEEPAPPRTRDTAEHQPVGALGILGVQFAQTALFPAHLELPDVRSVHVAPMSFGCSNRSNRCTKRER